VRWWGFNGRGPFEHPGLTNAVAIGGKKNPDASPRINEKLITGGSGYGKIIQKKGFLLCGVGMETAWRGEGPEVRGDRERGQTGGATVSGARQ